MVKFEYKNREKGEDIMKLFKAFILLAAITLITSGTSKFVYASEDGSNNESAIVQSDSLTNNNLIIPNSNVPSDGGGSMKACQNTSSKNVNISMQVTNLGGIKRSLAWGYRYTNSGINIVGPIVTQNFTAVINSKTTSGLYKPHEQASTYLFHGSISKYNIKGGPSGVQLKKGDLMTLIWIGNGILGKLSSQINCKIN
jgi:hypothetical protein